MSASAEALTRTAPRWPWTVAALWGQGGLVHLEATLSLGVARMGLRPRHAAIGSVIVPSMTIAEQAYPCPAGLECLDVALSRYLATSRPETWILRGETRLALPGTGDPLDFDEWPLLSTHHTGARARVRKEWHRRETACAVEHGHSTTLDVVERGLSSASWESCMDRLKRLAPTERWASGVLRQRAHAVVLAITARMGTLLELEP